MFYGISRKLPNGQFLPVVYQGDKARAHLDRLAPVATGQACRNSGQALQVARRMAETYEARRVK